MEPTPSPVEPTPCPTLPTPTLPPLPPTEPTHFPIEPTPSPTSLGDAPGHIPEHMDSEGHGKPIKLVSLQNAKAQVPRQDVALVGVLEPVRDIQ